MNLRSLFLLCIAFLCVQCASRKPLSMSQPAMSFDWEGHRGCRGLMPENTVPAFTEALKYPVTTLELDVVLSSDDVVIVSHEPWMNPDICLDPNGDRIPSSEKFDHNLYRLTAAEIAQYDCGSLGNPGFPDQQKMAVHKPALSEVVEAVRKACAALQRPLPYFNIEIKSEPRGYDIFGPRPDIFVARVLDEVHRLEITDHVILQSFDLNVLREIKAQRKENIPISFLTSKYRDIGKAFDELGFVPEIYSPNQHLVTGKMLSLAHRQNVRVIPWTVNNENAMRRLIRKGVDGLITDYPNLIATLHQ